MDRTTRDQRPPHSQRSAGTTAGVGLLLILLGGLATIFLLPDRANENGPAAPHARRAPAESPRDVVLTPAAADRGPGRADAAPTAGRARGAVASPTTIEREPDAVAPSRPTPGTVVVLVRDADSGRPVADAHVELIVSEAGTDAPSTHRKQTDARGKVRLAVKGEGSVLVSAWTEDSTGGPMEVDFEDRATESCTIALQRAAAVEGQIFDARDGQPIAGAAVSFWTFAETDRVLTDSAGRFRHPRFPVHTTSQQMRVSAPGYGGAVRYVEITPGGSWTLFAAHDGEADVRGASAPARFDVGLTAALDVTGRAVDPAGRPIAGALASAEGYFRLLPAVASRDGGEATADDAGRFELSGLRSDIGHAVSIGAPGFAPALLEVPSGPEGVTDLGDVVLDPAATLAGVVVDAGGLPVEDIEVRLRRVAVERDRGDLSPLDAGARVQTGRFRQRTDSLGTFLFDALGAGEYELTVKRDRGVIARLQTRVDAGELADGVRVDLPDSLVLLGRVRDDDGAVAGATVAVSRFGEVARVTTASDGSFRVAGLDDAATYELAVSDPESGATGHAVAWAYEEPVVRIGGPDGRLARSERP